MLNEELLNSREEISALVDGQLQGNEFSEVLALLGQSHEALVAWHSYHVIGDVLRSGDLDDARADVAFVSRLRSRLASPAGLQLSEDAVLIDSFQTSHSSPKSSGSIGSVPTVLSWSSANDQSRYWKRIAGFASLVAIAVIGWHLSGSGIWLDAASQLASAPAGGSARVASGAQMAATVSAEPPVMLRDARLDELLAAHKQFGGTSALQMPAGFLGNATFATSSRQFLKQRETPAP